jgi:hypothetical protein
MKRRIVILQSAALTAPFTVAPVAGALALMGLYLPWLVSSGISLLVLCFTVAFFRNPSQLRDAQEDNAPKQATAEATQAEATRSPIADPVLHLIAFIYTVLMLAVSSLNLLLPVTLEQPSFGLMDPASESRSRSNVASAAGIVGIPLGLLSLLTSTVLFLLVSSRIGDQNTVRLAGCIGPLATAVGALVSRVWQLSVALGVLGVGVGFFVPAIAPLLSSYVARSHRSKMAQATAIPLLGLQLGLMLGPQIIANIIDHWGLRTAWFCTAATFTLALVLMSEGAFRAAAPPAKPAATLSRRQSTLAQETRAQPVDKFVELVCADLRGALLPESPECKNLPVWNGLAQGAMRRALHEALPSMRAWDDSTDGSEHLQDVAAWLLGAGTQAERQEFADMFPAVCCSEDWNLCLNTMGADLAPSVAFNFELQRENSKHSVHSKGSKATKANVSPRCVPQPEPEALGSCESV